MDYVNEVFDVFHELSDSWKVFFFYGPVLFVWGWTVFKICRFFYQILFCTLVNENTNPEEIGLKKKDILTRVKLHKQFGDLPPIYPNGWFHLFESAQIQKGDVRRMDVLGLNLVAFRGQNGQVYVLDAYCPHLGANLGHGGVVRGDCIECPFHQWQFRGEDGECTHVPYDKPPKGAKIHSYTATEVNGAIWLWFDSEDREPFWHMLPVDDIQNGNFRQIGYTSHYFTGHVQEIAENSADETHFGLLHYPLVYSDQPWTPNLLKWLSKYWAHDFKVRWSKDPTANHISHMDMSHDFRMFGNVSFFTKLDADVIGPGSIYFHHNGPFGARGVFVYSFTPTGPMEVKFTRSFWLDRRLPILLGKFLMACEITQLERDVMVWHNKTYLRHPMLVKNDGPIKQFRNWYQQFYSEHSPKFTFKNEKSLDW